MGKKKYQREYMQKWRKKNPDKKYERSYQERFEYMRAYNKKNAKHLTERKRKYYLENKEYFNKKAKEHYQRNRERLLRKGKEERLEVVMAYGGKCVCCNETEIKFLALDHKNNDGTKHRKEVGLWGGKMYRWAKKNNYPDILQILCHNCNLAKAFYGKCPHTEKENT